MPTSVPNAAIIPAPVPASPTRDPRHPWMGNYSAQPGVARGRDGRSARGEVDRHYEGPPYNDVRNINTRALVFRSSLKEGGRHGLEAAVSRAGPRRIGCDRMRAVAHTCADRDRRGRHTG